MFLSKMKKSRLDANEILFAFAKGKAVGQGNAVFDGTVVCARKRKEVGKSVAESLERAFLFRPQPKEIFLRTDGFFFFGRKLFQNRKKIRFPFLAFGVDPDGGIGTRKKDFPVRVRKGNIRRLFFRKEGFAVGSSSDFRRKDPVFFFKHGTDEAVRISVVIAKKNSRHTRILAKNGKKVNLSDKK